MTIVLGIDGGGTKTHAVVADVAGALLGMGRSGPSNWEDVGIDGAGAALGEAAREAADAAGIGLSQVDGASLGLAGVDWDSDEKRLSPVVTGLGIGVANPAVARGALQAVDPARTGMASGINNTCRITGLAMGVAALGALLQNHVGARLAEAGYHGKAIGSAVSSSGLRAAHGNDSLAAAANVAFVSGFRLIILIGAATVLAGSLAATVLLRRRVTVVEAKTAPA